MPTHDQIRANKKMTPQARAIDCFNRLTSKLSLELCFKASTAKITTTADLLNTGIKRMDALNLRSYNEYCLEELEENGIVACSTLPKPAPVTTQIAPDQQPTEVPVVDAAKVAETSEAVTNPAEPTTEKVASTDEKAAEPVKEEVAVTDEKAAEPVKEEVAQTDEKAAEPVKEEVAVTEEKAAEPVKEEVTQTDEKTAEPVKEEVAVTEEKAAEPVKEEVTQTDEKAAGSMKDEVASTESLGVPVVPDDQAMAAVGISISTLSGNVAEDDLRVENYTLQSIELTSPESSNLSSDHIDL